MSAPRIGFTGSSRVITEAQTRTLYWQLVAWLKAGAEWMDNGDCVEADARAGTIWRNIGGKLHLRPPENDSKRAFLEADTCDPPRPYLVRNRVIVDQCTALIATPDGPERLRSGTWATVRYARILGRPILIIMPDGSCERENWPARDRGSKPDRAETVKQGSVHESPGAGGNRP